MRLKGRQPPPAEAPVPAPISQVQAPPNQRFLLAIHPHRWTVIEEYDEDGVLVSGLVPLTQQIAFRAGVNGIPLPGSQLVDGVRREQPIDPSEAIRRAVRKGRIVIPEDVQGPGTSYLRAYHVKGGTHWALEWQGVYAGSDQVGLADPAGYIAFWAQLVARGVIPACPAHELDRLREEWTNRLQEEGDKARTLPSHIPLLERCQRSLAVIQAAIDAGRPAKRARAKPAKPLTDPPQDPVA